MTAKHRKGKGNHKPEDNYFKNDATESDVRAGGNNPINPMNPILLLVLFGVLVIGGATGAWFCVQQHQTLTYLTDSLMGMKMKVVTLQSSHEELRQASGKQHISENLETRITALEESYALAQKQVGVALATAEQLKTSDLPAQVLSLHIEMKARLAEMQQATVSLEQLSQLQTTLKGKSEEFDGVRLQVEALTTLGAELTQKVGVLAEKLRGAELEERDERVSRLSEALEEQATEVLRLKQQLDHTQLDMAAVREEQSQQVHQPDVEERLESVRQSLQHQDSLQSELQAQLENVQEQLIQLMGQSEPLEPDEQKHETPADPEAAATTPAEDETLTDVEEEAEEEEQAEGPLPDEAPIEKEDAATEEAASAEEAEELKGDETEGDQSIPSLVDSELDMAQPEEEVSEEEQSEGEKVEESLLEEESHKVEEEASEPEDDNQSEETVSEGEGEEEESPLEEGGNTAGEEASEREEDNQPEEAVSEVEEVEQESLTEEEDHKADEEVASDGEKSLEEEPAAERQEEEHDVETE